MLVTQLAPNLLAVLQHIPTFYAQPCWNHILVISEDTLVRCCRYRTSLSFFPTRSLHTMPGLKKKKKKTNQQLCECSLAQMIHISPPNKYQNTAPTGGKRFASLSKERWNAHQLLKVKLIWRGKEQDQIFKKGHLDYRCQTLAHPIAYTLKQIINQVHFKRS